MKRVLGFLPFRDYCSHMAIQVPAPPPPLSFTGESKYRFDVFLSFRGEDTRHTFTVPLYNSLRRKGINAFIDDKKLGKGERIAPSLLKAIERSRISIIVFSENYANSTWCLDELAHIIRCKNEKNQLVMPIFYKVDPMAVQYQRDSFKADMDAHRDRFRDDPKKVERWRSALSEAASLSRAWLFKDEPGYEFGGFIERIVKDAYAMLPPKRLHSLGYMVGLEPRLEEAISLLNQSNDRVCMWGIYGTGGIGKTTFAKLIYKSIFYEYEGASFLFDVRETSNKYQGMVRLQQKLLSEILEEKIMTIGSVDEGISRIKHRLSHKKVLLVLDDVDEVEQLENLAGGCDWFGCGSKIIITTRNKQLLSARKVEKTYELMKLNEHDSLELFCWHAFHRSHPPKNYQDMSSCAISYAHGLPLALKVIGSNLGDRSLKEWRSILKQYERIQETTIHEVLKISYNCLQDGAQCIFLDIACFVDEKMLESIEEIEGYGSGARFYLEVLVDKSLITFVDNGSLSMHDLIRQMGKEIVRQKAPLNPEKRSRLWYYKDVLKVLRENSGWNNIEGIMLDPPKQEEVEWNGMAFQKMNNLRILIIRNAQFSIGPIYLPNSLRWLEWKGYPSTTLPTDFSPSELVVLKLPESSFKLKEPFKGFTNHVTHMNFSNCKFITEIPDMSQLQHLKRLLMIRCDNLIKVHDSLGSLSKLIRLDVGGCPKLSIFPHEIKMPSLELLHLNRCPSLDYFPQIVGKMDSLKVISIQDTAIKELPPSIGNLSRLESLSMLSCKSFRELPTSLFTLPNLQKLDLGDVHPCTRKSFMKLVQDIQPIICYYVKWLRLINCGLLDEELHLILSCFPNLQRLYLSLNDFVSLPKCIKECAQLRELDVSDCKRLRDIPAELPPNLHYVFAENCRSLTAESLNSLYSQAKKELSDLHIGMPTSPKFPDWFDYCCEGGTLSFCVRKNLPRAVLAFELGKAKNKSRSHLFQLFISINGRSYFNHRILFVKGGHVSLVEILSMELYTFKGMDWNDVEIQVISESPDISIARCGVYVYKQQTNMEDVQFKSPMLSTASLKRRSMASKEPPKKLLRKIKAADKGKLSIRNNKKGSRTTKPHSCYRRKMVFPMGKHVWRTLYH